MTSFLQKKKVFVESLFTGDEWLRNVVVEIDGVNSTKQIVPTSSSTSTDDLERIAYMIPPLMDLQLYGAYDKLYSEYPTMDTILAIEDYSAKGGAWYYQPTVATNDMKVMKKAIDTMKDFLRSKKGAEKRCLGIHLEGPWISYEKRGAHIAEYISSPTFEDVDALLDYGKNAISMITLAPEVIQEDEILTFLDDYGIVISAGHSNMTYDFAMEQFSKPNPTSGNPRIRTATHLYNAMSPFQHRAPGMVGAIWKHPTIRSSIVCDGYHVDFAAIALAKQLMGPRLFCITDAVTTTSSGGYQHYLQGDKYESQGVLSGSALTMLKAMNNLVDHVGIELDEAIRMCSLYPAEVMDRHTYTGKIFKYHQCESNVVLCLDSQRQFQTFV